MMISFELKYKQTIIIRHRHHVYIFERKKNNHAARSRKLRKSTYSFDALLKKRGDLTLSDRVHELASRVMRRHEFHAINEAVQLLGEEHDVSTTPHRVLGTLSQLWQAVLVENVLANQYHDTNDHPQTQEAEDTGHRGHTERSRLALLARLTVVAHGRGCSRTSHAWQSTVPE